VELADDPWDELSELLDDPWDELVDDGGHGLLELSELSEEPLDDVDDVLEDELFGVPGGGV